MIDAFGPRTITSVKMWQQAVEQVGQSVWSVSYTYVLVHTSDTDPIQFFLRQSIYEILRRYGWFFCPRSWQLNITFYVIVYLATDFSFLQSWYVCMPRWFICTERHILESIVVLDANLIGNVVMPGMDERKPFVMRLSILNIKKNICASARCYCIWVGIFTSAHVPETVSTAFPFPIFSPRAGKGSGVVGGGELYTGKWWTTRDLFLGWIYYLFTYVNLT